MLACSACNLSKLAKRVFDPAAPERRLLKCTEENEFPEHIVENERCEWVSMTPAGDYHLRALDLNERSHIKRRKNRKLLYENLKLLETNAVKYLGPVHIDALKEFQRTLENLRQPLKTCVPFPTESGLVSPVLSAPAFLS